jgi:prevent-host-death family protein
MLVDDGLVAHGSLLWLTMSIDTDGQVLPRRRSPITGPDVLSRPSTHRTALHIGAGATSSRVERRAPERACEHQCKARYNRGMSTMTVSEARAALPQILDRVVAGEEVTITRHGKPVAVVVRPDSLRVRRADAAFATAATVHKVLDRSRRTPLPARPTLSSERAEALVAETRQARASR